MAAQSVAPLRVQKGTNSSSPNRSAMAQNRPLSEISPMALRRNSPSFPRGSLSKADTSPMTSSPFNVANTSSPRLFWQGRDPASPSAENQNPYGATSPSKRSSIENLKKASRVKNSTMFAREQQSYYDPSKPNILDGRPLSAHLQGNAYDAKDFAGLPADSSPEPVGPENDISNSSTLSQTEMSSIAPLSPSKMNSSPTKSSLSKKTGANMRRSGFDPDTGIWEDEDDEEKKLPEGRRLHRHAKSVTFDKAPPQINEYEMTTPDPSSVASGSREGSYDSFDEDDDMGYDRGSSVDHDDSFDASLEDTDKTPVVLPEDWRFMSPSKANTALSQHEEDVFDEDDDSPEPTAQPGTAINRSHQTSVNSVDSNGQSRPLPPLPPTASGMTSHSRNDSLSGTLERMNGSHRALPSPPPASLSKSDLRRMSAGSLSLEDRLRLMMLKDQDQQKSEAEVQRERRMRRAGSKDSSPSRNQANSSESNTEHVSRELPAQKPTHITRLSRDSILKELQDRSENEDFSERNQSKGTSFRDIDPDIAIPSREDPTQNFDDESDTLIKEEDVEDSDIYSIPDLYKRHPSGESGVSDGESSHYSQASLPQSQVDEIVDENDTPRAQSPVHEAKKKTLATERMSLPEFMDFGDESSFVFGLDSYITPPAQEEVSSKPLSNRPKVDEPANLPNLAALRSAIQRPYTPEEQLEPPKPAYAEESTSSDPGSPSSVIRHASVESPSPDVSEPSAGSKSSEHVSESINPEPQNERTPEPEQLPSDLLEPQKIQADGKRVSSLVQLDFPRDEQVDGLGMGLEAEFDRVVEAQKRGYLMRQNTKVVVASERNDQEGSLEGQQIPFLAPSVEAAETPAVEANQVQPSPRKASQPTWTAEPWNGKVRRKSIRIGGETSPTKKKITDGPVPPLPGQSSAVNDGLGSLAEDELAEEEAEEFEDGTERGRLFVKVVGAKDLQLPFPQPHYEKTHFALTLDNGLHCVTTSWLDLARHAPIGQEFELVVLNELEFQLTLQMKVEEPKPERPQSPTKAPVSPKKQGALGRIFGSPKKKKESDARTQQEVMAAKRASMPPSTYDLVQGLVGKDGSFARAYVSLSEYEKHAYGRPYSVDVKCFNEWAMEEVTTGSSRSKKSVTQLQQRPPYEIGKLELQLLYVPKPKGAKDEDMPKSMNGAIRAMREAEEKAKQQATIKEFEGHLSQQGGDCPYWRRRFFKLVGSKLTAYHELTRQPRATINLAKAAKLIDDKSSLTQKETSTKGGGRRKSAFADDEEGYMFVEEGFRIRFANGEVIDFYADSTEAKEEWMRALSQAVGKSLPSSSSSSKGWTEMVLKREKSLSAKAHAQARKTSKEAQKQQYHAQHQSTQQAQLTSPVRSPQKTTYGASGIPIASNNPFITPRLSHGRTESYQGDSSRSQANSPVKSKLSKEERYRKTKSMYA